MSNSISLGYSPSNGATGAKAQLPFYVTAYGAKGDGTTDDTDAFTAAYTAAVAANGSIRIPAGTYVLNSTWIINANVHVIGEGPGSVLKAKTGFTGSAIVQYGANDAGGPHINAVLRGFKCDPNSQSLDGIVIYKAQNLRVENIYAPNCRYGFFCDGQYDIRILNVRFADCYTSGCTVGYRFVGASGQTSSFDTFLIENCSSESDATGVYFSGDLNNHLTLLGGEIQSSTTAGVHAVGTFVAIRGTYIETTGSSVPTVKGETGTVIAADVSANIGHPTLDATSALIATGGNLSSMSTAWNGTGVQRVGAYDGEIDGQGWGPPNWPSGKNNFQSIRGQTYTDSQGVTWTCTKDGITTGTKPRWCALDGEIRIPLAYSDIANGSAIWFPQEDFVVTDLDVFVTTTFTGGTYIKLGDGNQLDNYISQTQGAVANLVAGARLSARRNKTATALLAPPIHGHGLAGADAFATPNAVRTYLSGTFTAGALLVVIRGYYPLTGIRGTVTDEAVGRPASALTQTYSNTSRTLNAYTTNAQSSAYTGGTDTTTQTNLNALRVAYENLRASHDNLLQFVNALVDDLQAMGIEP